jgi:hypothetical protein
MVSQHLITSPTETKVDLAPGATALHPQGDRLAYLEQRVQHNTTPGLHVEKYASEKDVFLVGDMNHGDLDLQLGFLGLLPKLKELGFTTVAVERPPSFNETDINSLRLPLTYAALQKVASDLGMKIAQVDLEYDPSHMKTDPTLSGRRGVEMGKNVAALVQQGERVVLFCGAAHVDAPDQIRKVLHDQDISLGGALLYSLNQKKHLDDQRPTHVLERVPAWVQHYHPKLSSATTDIGAGFSVDAFLVCEAIQAGKGANSADLSFNFEEGTHKESSLWISHNRAKISTFVREMLILNGLPADHEGALTLALNGYCFSRSDNGLKHPGSIIGIDYRKDLKLFLITLVDTGGYEYDPQKPVGIKRTLGVSEESLLTFNTAAMFQLSHQPPEQPKVGSVLDNNGDTAPTRPGSASQALSVSNLDQPRLVIDPRSVVPNPCVGSLDLYALDSSGNRGALVDRLSIDEIPLSEVEAQMRRLAAIARQADILYSELLYPTVGNAPKAPESTTTAGGVVSKALGFAQGVLESIGATFVDSKKVTAITTASDNPSSSSDFQRSEQRRWWTFLTCFEGTDKPDALILRARGEGRSVSGDEKAEFAQNAREALAILDEVLQSYQESPRAHSLRTLRAEFAKILEELR